jgi:tetratricopeptide (TPR) repeat protein
VPGWWREILVRGLAVDPAGRWPSIAALAKELERRRARPRRIALWGVALVAIGSVAGYGVAAALARQEPPCDPTSSAIVATWNDDERAAVEEAFRAVDVPYAEDVLRTVVARLDRQRADWEAGYVAACEASVRAEQSPALLDRRMACLDERRRELGAVVDVLREADAGVVLRGVETVGGLGSLDACADLDALQSGVEPPPVEHAAAVSEIRAQVQAAGALQRAGRVDEAASQWTAAHAAAEAIGWRPLLVELEVTRVTMSRLLTDVEAEAERQRHWFDEALGIGDAQGAAQLARAIGAAAGNLRNEHAESLAWLATARALSKRFDPGMFEVSLLNAEAISRIRAHEFDEATLLLERAIAIAEELEPGGLRAAMVRMNLAGLWGERGEYERAVPLTLDAIRGYEALLGEHHPLVADVVVNLGGVQLLLGDLDQASAAFARADAILAPLLPADHPQRTHLLANEAMLARLRGDRPRAIELQRRVLAARKAANHQAVLVQAYTNLAIALLDDPNARPDELAEVDSLAERALAVAKRIGPREEEIRALCLRANVGLRRGDTATAAKWSAEAEAVLAGGSLRPDHRLEVHATSASTAVARGDRPGAIAAIDAAERVLADLPDRSSLTPYLSQLARARWDANYDRARALALSERAERLLVRTGGMPSLLSEVRAWRAEREVPK